MEQSKLKNAVSGAGRSLLEILWEELDSVMDRLMDAYERPSDVPPKPSVENRAPLAPWRGEWMAYGETRGQAQGLAYAIATITDPYNPNVPAVKKVAVQRYNNRNGIEDE